MKRIRVFFSYTLRDNEISKPLLNAIKNKLYAINYIDTYFDLLDNNSNNPQQKVYEELDKADMVCLIESREIYNSSWVNKELEVAKQNQMPILVLTIQEIEELLSASNYIELEKSGVVQRINLTRGRMRLDIQQSVS